MAKKKFEDMLKIKREIPVEKIKIREISQSKPHYKIWLVAVFSIVFLFFAISFVFSSAKITVVPKTKQVKLNQIFSAVKDSSVEGDLPFDLIVLSGDTSKMVQAGTERD